MRTHPLSAFLLSLGLAACGGGGGGGSTNVRLEGQLTVPSLGVGGGSLVDESAYNDVAHCAESIGRIDTGGRMQIRGRVGGGDVLDVFEVDVAPGSHVAVAVDGPVEAVAIDGTGGALLAARDGLLTVEHGKLHLAVGAGEGGTVAAYRLSLEAVAPAGQPSVRGERLASGETAAAVRARYLGAAWDMIPGEVVVWQDELAPLQARTLSDLGLVAKPAGAGGPIRTYRLAMASALPRAAGVALTRSLELETAEAARRVASLPGVRAASPNYLYRAFADPNDPLLGLQWHYDQINLRQAWNLTQGSAGVIVAIVDTGIVLGHPDFAGRLIAGFDMISDPARALDGDGIDNDPDDPGDGLGTGLPSSFHGTHVGGTVGASTDNSEGVAGVDWSCRLMPIRVLGKGGSGSLDDIAQGILWGAGLANVSGTTPAVRCDIMNLSLGGPGSATVLEQACNAASAAGVLLVVAAGNDGASTPNFPASYDVCLSVGSTRFDRQRAPYSNFASTLDIVAPGGDTSVDQNQDGRPDGVLSCLAALDSGNVRQLGYGFLQGTSMASPHVAGVAALVKAAAPGLTAAQIRNILITTAIDLGPPGKDTDFGNGLVDAFAAVQAAGAVASNPILNATPSPLGIGFTATTASILLANVGAQSPQLVIPDPAGVSISYDFGTGSWITQTTLVASAGGAISHDRLDLTVSRTGLADGRYEATVTITPSSPAGVSPVSVRVVMEVGTPSASQDDVFVLVVDADTLENLGQAQTSATQTYAYALAEVVPGSYLLVAGTDRDNDGFIGDEGELFGIWPSTDSPLVLQVNAGQGTIRGLDFALQDQGLTMARGAPPGPIRLR